MFAWIRRWFAIRALESPKLAMRLGAVDRLRRLRGTRVENALIGALIPLDPDVCLQALDALAERACVAALSPVIDLLAEPEPRIRDAAKAAADRIDSQWRDQSCAHEAFQSFMAVLLSDASPAHGDALVDAVFAIDGQQATIQLLPKLPGLAEPLCTVIQTKVSPLHQHRNTPIGRELCAATGLQLSQGSAERSARAISLLRELGGEDAASALMAAIPNLEPPLLLAAVDTLEDIAPDWHRLPTAIGVLPVLLPMLADPQATTRLAPVVNRFRGEAAMPVLARHVFATDVDQASSDAVLEILEAWDPDWIRDDAVQQVADGTWQETCRSLAVCRDLQQWHKGNRILRRIGGYRPVFLEATIGDSKISVRVRDLAIQIAVRLRLAGGIGEPLLRIAMDREENIRLRCSAIRALGSLNRQEAAEGLMSLLEQRPDRLLLEAAVMAIGILQHGPAADFLVKLIQDHSGLRFLPVIGVKALHEILGGEAVRHVLPILEKGPSCSFLEPYVGAILADHAPQLLESGTAQMNSIRSKYRSWQRDAATRTVEQVFEILAEGCRRGRTDLNRIAAIESTRIALHDGRIDPAEFLELWQGRGYRRRQLGIELDAYQLAEQWAVGGFWIR